ncbi:MAG: hypothetical protein GC161_04235 [Planctomycetaceae bacterium]|nr:hypothetical protein [Planctomycetaceae bacterium]
MAPFDPPLFVPSQRAAVGLLRGIEFGRPWGGDVVGYDGELGWQTFGPDYGKLGERLSERGPRSPNARRVALIGCSFTHGDEVEAEQTWAHHLAELRPDLDPWNLGVGGYGLDQAVLRLERVAAELQPDEIWIGLMTSALPRLLSLYRPAENHWSGAVAFKPRVRWESGTLVDVPCAADSPETLLALLGSAERFWTATGALDQFVARAPLAYAPRGSHWTHRSGIARLALTWHESRLRPTLAARLADPEGELRGLTRALVARAGRAGQGPVRVLVVPSRGDLADPAPGFDGLLEQLRADGHLVHDLSRALIASPSDWRPGGHYGPEQNLAVAEALAELVALPRVRDTDPRASQGPPIGIHRR